MRHSRISSHTTDSSTSRNSTQYNYAYILCVVTGIEVLGAGAGTTRYESVCRDEQAVLERRAITTAEFSLSTSNEGFHIWDF